MERFIANLVKDFERGTIDRRQFCEGVALAATVFAAGSAAQAAPYKPAFSSSAARKIGVSRIDQ